ncbi:microneme protein [Cyclospora cayetanensis]|uniref:Microneme protein n=1 Tax=Cyclospora cayetanensis TaxID=88456 RepID=A0A1D3CT86_9EIME|nr:microneme protein [Cyclospora cayetanensis]
MGELHAEALESCRRQPDPAVARTASWWRAPAGALDEHWEYQYRHGTMHVGQHRNTFGVAQESAQDQVCTSLLDVFLVIDESGSIGSSNYVKVRAFLADFYLAMPVTPEDVRIGLLTFSTTSKLRWDLSDPRSTDPVLAGESIMSLPSPTGNTYTNLALDMASELLYDTTKGARKDVPKLVMVMTDGVSSRADLTLVSATNLREKGAIIVVLGVGAGVKAKECTSIAGCESETNCTRYLQTDWTKVSEEVSTIIEAACLDLAKDAVCSEWSDYGPCEGECSKEGLQTSTRTEISPQKPGTPPCSTCEAPQGRTCAEQAPGLTRTKSCTMPVCKVDAHCGEFGEWSTWNTTCGTATRRRQRSNYNSPPASGGGLSCLEQNPPKSETEVEIVDKVPCPVQQQPGPWAEWNECTATCGGGSRYRGRVGLPQEGDLYGGETLEAQGIPVRETEVCNENPCPIDANCGDWNDWTDCSRSCGGGSQSRKREPWLDNAQFGGRSCIQQHPEGQSALRTCNAQPCPVDEIVGDWELWGACSERCGPGVQVRHRGQSKQEAMYGGKTIAEQNEELADGEKILLTEQRECENNPCGPCTLPFTEWTDCPVCSGTRSRQTMVIFDFFDGKCTEHTNERAVVRPTACESQPLMHQLLLRAGQGSSPVVEVENEIAPDSSTADIAEQEREALISPGEQTEMWSA